ncbi:PAS domain S-box protein [Leptospira gomenensis]|uniref:Sensor protein FixL n=1 Tax=Leptospira gomenensis TaxID=2484974 RepID=A0A5F1YFE1_9LEPT|nr:PAS domain S-box protein [Leptospira gomenensis]TGK38612.1 PAS domain S-box protein [Leptospira gomenensis]TGK42849.1 PAS domain S-box protein [Leptospira gomenensis]TGK49606.1 PAS domain S-box protein [Leptospira gomenensis]TGK60724.1 PAS domain S-box protein [Leptospira gomenensis]
MNSKSESTEYKPPIFHSDRSGNYLSSNEEFHSFLEIQETEQSLFRFTKSVSDRIVSFAKDAFQDKLIVSVEFTTESGFFKKRSVFLRKIFKDEEVFEVEGVVLPETETRRPDHDARFVEINRSYLSSKEINRWILRAKSVLKLYEGVCKILIEEKENFGLVCFATVEAGKNLVFQVAFAGETISLADPETQAMDLGPGLAAVKSGTPVIIEDIEELSDFVSWKNLCVRAGLLSMGIFPIFLLGELTSVFCLFSKRKNFFLEEETDAYIRISGDIELGLKNIRESEHRFLAVNAMRESDERFQAIFETVVDAIVMITPKGTIIMFNSAAEKMFGYNFTEVVGKNVNFLMPEPYHSEHDQYLYRYLETGEKKIIGIGREVAARKKDGSVFPVELAVSEFFQNQNRYFVGVIRDITARKKSETELLEKTDALEELNRSLEARVESEIASRREQEKTMIVRSRLADMGEMIGNIAHQWRQPLNAIGLLVQDLDYVFAAGDLDEKYISQNTKKIMEILEQMSSTIDDFRNYFRPNKTKEKFSLKTVINKTVSLISGSLKNQNIKIFFNSEEDYEVFGFPNEFSQVILNVLANSRDAISENKPDDPEICVELRKEGDLKVVLLSDNGGGIAPEILEKLFQPYFTTKDQGQGTGIGLYMSKSIIENNMGGRIQAQNQGKGALIRIELP